MTLTAERLRELLAYDPETGIFTRLTDNRRGNRIGDVVGTRCKLGYLWTYLDGRQYTLGRLAWLYVTGEWPEHEIDHINGEKTNNRFANLRDACRQTNMQNEHRARSNSSTGYAGVSFRKERGKYIATIDKGDGTRKRIRLGSFYNPVDAHNAYLEAKRKYHPGFTK